MTLLCSVATLLAALAAGAAPGPALIVDAPAGVGARFAAALSGRMPDVRVAAEGQGATDLRVSLAPVADRWRLAVQRGGGRVAFVRELSAPDGPDAAFLESCAAVVERYLQDLDWRGGSEAIDPDSVAQVPAPPALPPQPLAPAPAATPRPPTEVTLAVGAAGAAGLEPGSWRSGPALDVELGRGRLLAAIRAYLFAPATHAVELAAVWSGSRVIHEMPVAAAAMGGACLGRRLVACGGIELGWRGTYGWSGGGDMYLRRSSVSNAFLAGLFGQLGVRLPSSFQARALLSAAGFTGDGGFAVGMMSGKDEVNTRPPRFEIGLGLELARQVP